MRNQQRKTSVRWIAAALGTVTLLTVGATIAMAAPVSKAPAGVAGMQVFIDPATGKIRPATAHEMKMMSERLQASMDRSTAGLQVQQHSNGMLSMDLQGGFLNVWVASLGSEGRVVNSCVTDYATAEAILSGQQGAPVYEEQ
ncbi:MAG TPA: hypothetical protein VKM72_08905 [Thermoanaerobaculia bacterium]|nr:hypothetical protein [Thermoanaerobaculia bacterium]